MKQEGIEIPEKDSILLRNNDMLQNKSTPNPVKAHVQKLRHLSDLPDELILHLGKCLHPLTFRRFSLTCKRFYHCFYSTSTCLGFHIENLDQICYPIPKKSTLPASDPAVHVSPDGFLVQFSQNAPSPHLLTPAYDRIVRLETTEDGVVSTAEKYYGFRKQGERNVFSRMPLGTQRRFLRNLKQNESSEAECLYFEAHVLDAAPELPLRIGLCSTDRDHLHPPGTIHNSIGYQSTDGYIALGNRYGELFQFASPWKKGDIVGCGYCHSKNTGPCVFFTLNGNWVGEAPYHMNNEPENYACTWFPSFSSAGPATICLNVGQSPFAYSMNQNQEAPFLLERSRLSMTSLKHGFSVWRMEPNTLPRSSDPYHPPMVDPKGFDVVFPDNGGLVSRSVQSSSPIFLHHSSALSVSSSLRDTNTPEETNFYFEVEILHVGEHRNAFISIGIATRPYSPFHQIGWDRNSIGFHSDDGRVFQNSHQTGKVISDPYGQVGSIVGCGFNPMTRHGFFTLNGLLKHTFYMEQEGLYYMSIGAIRAWRVRVNVGQEPFRYVAANTYRFKKIAHDSVNEMEE